MPLTGYPIDFIGLETELKRIGVDSRSLPIFHNKSRIRLYKIIQIDARAAMILKQLFLSSGGDVAVNWEVIRFSCEKTDAIIFGTTKHYQEVLTKLQFQPFFGLEAVAKELQWFIRSNDRFEFPRIMGILNVTPDSFSDGGQFQTLDQALKQANTLLSEGADILDIGGESSRPGSDPVSEEDELSRIIPVIQLITQQHPSVPVSVDTYKPKVAEMAIKAGGSIINCIQYSSRMMEVVSQAGVQCVLMHMKGTPKDMQQQTNYPDGIISEMHHFFEMKLEEMKNADIHPSKIWLDPGIGFAKTPEQNLHILHHLDSFLCWDRPILLGHSRKSFINALYHLPVENRTVCTAIYSYIALNKGASILRVHDVAETKLALQIFQNQLYEP